MENTISKAAAVLGANGGAVASEAQKAAARVNGRNGGRPRSYDIEAYQGLDADGNPFGYDHERHNFITWGRSDDGLHAVPVSVENDTEESEHGSVDATRRAAAHCGRRVTWCSHLGKALGLECRE